MTNFAVAMNCRRSRQARPGRSFARDELPVQLARASDTFIAHAAELPRTRYLRRATSGT